jgi:hypothetical protein
MNAVNYYLQSYIIDPDFLMNYDIKEEQKKSLKEDDLDKKCYPKRASNQMPYQKIEIEIRKDAHWPPITEDIKHDSEFINDSFKHNNNLKSNEILTQINENYLNETKKRQKFEEKNLETSF